jgi:hypothetical protein
MSLFDMTLLSNMLGVSCIVHHTTICIVTFCYSSYPEACATVQCSAAPP